MSARVLSGLAQEAARILCEESLTDYRAAKHKAAERMGLGAKAALPANSEVQAAILEYQRLFGGPEYAERLVALRRTAVQAMTLLAEFDPRLVGGAVTGAVTAAHRVQLHVFTDKPELLDLFFHDRGIDYEQGEREYRYPDGRSERVPLLCFEAGAIGVDVAGFYRGDERQLPLSPADGLPMKRLRLSEAQALASAAVEIST